MMRQVQVPTGKIPGSVKDTPASGVALDALEIREHEHLSRGLALHLQGKLREALSEYQSALALNTKDPYGHYLAGLALMAIGCDRKAHEEWRKAKALRAQDEDSDWGNATAKKLLDSRL